MKSGEVALLKDTEEEPLIGTYNFSRMRGVIIRPLIWPQRLEISIATEDGGFYKNRDWRSL